MQAILVSLCFAISCKNNHFRYYLVPKRTIFVSLAKKSKTTIAYTVSKTAIRLENHLIYTPFEFLLRARELLNNILENIKESQQNKFLKNIDKLHSPVIRSEKKILKNLKLTNGENLVEYTREKIMRAERIVDEGRISGCIFGGNYLFIYVDDEVFTINSETYEIIYAKKIKK